MSILAGKKRKEHFSNPNSWANESNTFGKKMLEKMGWSKGKGLGRKLDGMTTCIKVRQMSDYSGVGFKDSNDQWTAHEDNFTDLLKSLQADASHTVINGIEGNNEAENSSKSLEAKSKSSRARLHYKKFTRGKDLTRYSSKDLANIFGRQTLEKSTVKADAQRNISHGGSMTDYFKKKMANIKASSTNQLQQDVTGPEEQASDFDGKPAFSSCFQGFQNDQEQEEKQVHEQVIEVIQEEEVGYKKNKKRKRKRHEIEESELRKVNVEGVANPGFYFVEGNSEEVSLNNDTNEMPETPYEVKVKKKKTKKPVENGVENPNFNVSVNCFENSIIIEQNPYEIVPDSSSKKDKKKKKKKKQLEVENKNGFDNPTFNGIDKGHVLNEPAENPYEVIVTSEKKKKKKKKQQGVVDIENSTFEELKKSSAGVIETPKHKKLKKTEKLLREDEDFTIEEVFEEKSVIKKKHKRMVHATGGGEPAIETETEVIGYGNLEDSSSSKKNKKLKKSSPSDETSLGTGTDVISTPTTRTSNDFGISDDLIMNVASVPDLKPILATPQGANRLNRRKSVRFDESSNQQRIIPNVVLQKQINLGRKQTNELFDINNAVIKRSLELENTATNTGIANEGFDIASVDQQSHYDHNMVATKKQWGKENRGIGNPAFSNLQEEVQNVRRNLEDYQAEVENDINESKQINFGQGTRLNEHILMTNGHVKLALRKPIYIKRTYKNLIRGDIEVEFKNTNLHQIKGYATSECILSHPIARQDFVIPEVGI